jgi:hypothetical protein
VEEGSTSYDRDTYGTEGGQFVLQFDLGAAVQGKS